MTPVGVALIVGGITTLIVFRAALFRSARRDKRAAEARRGAGPDGEARTPGRRTGGTDDSGAGRQGRRAARTVEAPAAHAAVVGGAKPAGAKAAKRSKAGSRTKSVSGKGAAGRLSGDGPDGDAEPGAARSEFDPAVSGGARPGYGRSAEFVGAGSRALVRPAVAQPVPMEVPDPRPNRRTRRAAVRPASLPHLGEPLDVEASTAPSGPVARRFWPTIGVPAPEPDPVSRFEAAPEPVTDRSARSLLHRLIDLEDDDSLPAPAGAAPTDVRLLALGLPDDGVPADDPGEPADQGGDPELDIDQDLDRAAEPGGEDERSRALDLPGVDHGYVADREADLSGHFDAVAGSDGTGAFSGLFADVSLADADETGLVPAAETDWAEPADPRYGDRVEGWVRPQYQDEPEPAAGEYWTPVPAGSYETEYGWPTPVERLPEVPPYPPATGFDVPVAVEAEPTAAVPLWPPARPDDRIELPRSWSHRSETGPAFRTPVDRDRPVALRPVAGLPAETGRFGSEAAYQE